METLIGYVLADMPGLAHELTTSSVLRNLQQRYAADVAEHIAVFGDIQLRELITEMLEGWVQEEQKLMREEPDFYTETDLQKWRTGTS
jgi:hypothetical protein